MYVSLGQTTTRAPIPSSSTTRTRLISRVSAIRPTLPGSPPSAPSMPVAPLPKDRPPVPPLQTPLEQHEQEQAWRQQAAAEAAAAAAAEEALYADEPYMDEGDMYPMTDEPTNGQQQQPAAANGKEEPNYLLYAGIGVGALALVAVTYMLVSGGKR